jgi:hypothetical protein
MVELMADAAIYTTIPAPQPGLSTEIPGRLEDTVNLVGRAVSDRALSAATTMADKSEVFRNAVAPASAAAEDFRAVEAEGFMAVAVEAEAAVAVAGTADGPVDMFLCRS